jgi:hypothetical protein
MFVDDAREVRARPVSLTLRTCEVDVGEELEHDAKDAFIRRRDETGQHLVNAPGHATCCEVA